MIFNSLIRVVLIGIFFLFFSCGNKHHQKEPSLYEIKKTNFQSQIGASGYLEAANSVSIMCPRLFTDLTILFLIPEGSHVQKGDTVCILEASEIQNNFENSLNELEIAKIRYNKTYEDLQLQYLLLRSQVRAIEATARITELDSIQKQFVSESEKKIIGLEIQKSGIEKRKLENKLKSLKLINEAELQKMKLRIIQSQNNVDRSKDVLDKLTIVSPVNGLIEYARRWGGDKVKEGDIVWGNMPLLNIPEMSKMQAKLIVCEANYKRINPGQKLLITIDAFPEINLEGIIKRKSPAGRPVRKNNPVKVYDIYASIDSIVPDLQPGLSLSCQVVAEELIDTFSIPLTSLFEEDTVKFVYLKKKNKYQKQIIEVGPQSSTHIVVSKGLREEDIISLISPFKKL